MSASPESDVPTAAGFISTPAINRTPFVFTDAKLVGVGEPGLCVVQPVKIAAASKIAPRIRLERSIFMVFDVF